MGRQWLQKKRELNAAKRGKISNKLVREITVAAKMGMPDPNNNARLAVAVEAARKQSVPNDTIQRAIKKGSGALGDGVQIEMVAYEGFGPHKVPVIVECMTDNRNRTAPEMRTLFRNGQMGAKVGFFFDHVGIVEATHEGAGLDVEGVAIEAGAQNVEPLEHVPEGQSGARFLTDVHDLDKVTDVPAHVGLVGDDVGGRLRAEGSDGPSARAAAGRRGLPRGDRRPRRRPPDLHRAALTRPRDGADPAVPATCDIARSEEARPHGPPSVGEVPPRASGAASPRRRPVAWHAGRENGPRRAR